METIEIMVRNKIPRFKKDSAKSIITWNTGYIINFDFDEEWEHVKTLRVVNDKGDIIIPDIVFEGNSVELPKITDTNHIGIGVFSGNLSSTTKLILACRKSILEDDGAPLPPTEDVYNQIMGILEGKAEKSTTLSGYGITDAYTKNEIDVLVGDISSILNVIQNNIDETVELQDAYIGGGIE